MGTLKRILINEKMLLVIFSAMLIKCESEILGVVIGFISMRVNAVDFVLFSSNETIVDFQYIYSIICLVMQPTSQDQLHSVMYIELI